MNKSIKANRRLNRKPGRRESFVGILFCLPSTVGMMLFFAVPFGVCVCMSFAENLNISNFVGVQNYIDVLSSAAFRLAAWNTLKFNLVAVPLIMVISLAVALLLFRKLRGYNFFRTVFIFPLVLPVASVVLVFQIIFSETGMINNILGFLNITPVDWINSSNSFFMLVVLYLWKNSGYNIILFFSALNSIPKEYCEASEIDGAGSFTQLFKITLPLIIPYTFFILVISIINSFKSFREAFILFGPHPNRSIYMIQHFMNNNFQNLNYLRLAVGAIMIFVVIFILILLLFRLRKKAGDVEL
ncbi:MAG: sugar ABC transporter permease [Oscillospiraceae bacterium]|nr:sugar ABC transporter permease [Oscillospiraceae bacterium]